MIVKKSDKTFLIRSDAPDSNFTGEPEGSYYLVDDASSLAEKIRTLFPYYDFVDVDGTLVDVVVAVPDSIKWVKVREQRDELLKQVKVMGELVLFLAESEAIKAGKITAAERTITGARALDIALYMRNLYRVMQQANPDNIDWPAEP